LFSLLVLIAFSQNQEMVWWTGQNTSTYTYPQAANTPASFVTSASQNYSGLSTVADNRNVWNNPNASTTLDVSTAPYLEYTLNISSNVDFDRFVVHGIDPFQYTKTQLRWDVDSFNNSLGEFTYSPPTSYELTSVDLSGSTTAPAGTVTFRIYFYNAAGWVFHSDTGPYSSSDATPSSYTSYGRCFSIWGAPAATPCTPTSATDAVTACNSYTWIDGITYTASNNSATDTLTNAAGCDSVVSLDLTINTAVSTSSDTITACDSYTWNGLVYTASGSYADTLLGANTCDSIAMLELTILNSSSSIDSITVCDSLVWINGVTYYSNNYSATHTLSNALGCDSVVSLALTILNSSSSFNEVYTYDTSYVWNGVTYDTSGTYHHYTTNAVGCDSTATLALTFLDNPFEFFPISFCEHDSTSYPLPTGPFDLVSGAGINSNSFSPSVAGAGTHTLVNEYINNVTSYDIDSNGAFGFINIDSICSSIWLEDDDMSHYYGGMYAIDFPFLYWGELVDSFIISSNGWITFDSNSSDDYAIGLPVADEDYDNSIFLIDVDLDPEAGDSVNTGLVKHATVGQAPNRILIVEFSNVPYYDNNSVMFNAQLHLFEGSNRIEIHTQSANNVANGETASQGLQSPDENVAVIVPGRDDQMWTAYNDYKGFTPSGVSSVSISHTLAVYPATYGVDAITACGNYTWVDGNTYTADNNTATFTYTNALGCDSIVTLDLSITPMPDVNTISCSNCPTITAITDSASYTWLNCDDFSIIAGEMAQSFTPVENGSYAVIVEENGCVDTSACIEISTIGAIESSFAHNFSLYPNPTNGKVHLSFTQTQEELTISLYALNGQLIQEERFNGLSQLGFEVEAPAGMYLLNISNQEGEKAVIRLVKH
jgi:hypothetical protein